MRFRLLPLVACLALPARAQEPSAPALGYRMAGLDLAVFDAVKAATVGLSPPRSKLEISEGNPPHVPLLAHSSPPSEEDSAWRVAWGDGTTRGGSQAVPVEASGFVPFSDTLEAEPGQDGVNAWRVAAFTAGAAGAALFVMETQRRRWWEDRNPHFHVSNDWAYVRWADKLGHFYAASLLTRSYRSALRWSGVSGEQARLWGAVGGFANHLYYEVLDGFGPRWGFSPGDVAFNTLGVYFATAQADDPRLDAVFLKMSYWPSGWEGKNPTDDYAGQTYWLTANPHRLAPEPAQRVLPPWLNVAVGYGARDRDEQDFLTTSLVYVGLELEPAGLPFRGRVWDALVPVLRHVHFPGPAVRLTPDLAFVPFAF